MSEQLSYKTNTIQLIKRIGEQYYQNSIIKELIQNADDAGATQLHIGLINHFKDNVHPLLCSPGIFILNNGVFTSPDEKGLSRLHTGTKGSDHHSIGKFGLGMKSVFHIC
jgi:HSP90 family molecular chaperone